MIDVVMPTSHGKILKVCVKILKMLQARGDLGTFNETPKFTIAALADRKRLGLGAGIYRNTTTEHLAEKFRYMSTEVGNVSPFVVPDDVLKGKGGQGGHHPSVRLPAPLVGVAKDKAARKAREEEAGHGTGG